MTTVSTSWVGVPDLIGCVSTESGGSLAITVSGEVNTPKDTRMLVRALVNGRPANPPQVVFAGDGSRGIRTFTFFKKHHEAGPQTVKIQWRANASGEVRMGDRVMTVHSSPGRGKKCKMMVKVARIVGLPTSSTARTA